MLLRDNSKICKIFDLDKKCISEANSWLIFTYDPPNQSLEPPLQEKIVWWCFIACKGPKNGKNANVGNFGHVFANFRPITGNKTLPNYIFLVEEVLSFDLLVICENQLRIGFRNEFLTFTSENEVDLDELHILKVTFRNGLEMGMGNFPQHFPQDFPATISHKISPQKFPARFPVRFSHKSFLQEFPTRFLTRFSQKIFLQQFPTTISHKISHNNFPQQFPTRFSTAFPARISHKIFPQDFPELDPDWLAPHHPFPNAKCSPITALLNIPTYHKSAKVSPPPFSKSHGNPKSMNKLTLMSQQ